MMHPSYPVTYRQHAGHASHLQHAAVPPGNMHVPLPGHAHAPPPVAPGTFQPNHGRASYMPPPQSQPGIPFNSAHMQQIHMAMVSFLEGSDEADSGVEGYVCRWRISDDMRLISLVQGATIRQPSSAAPLYHNPTEKWQALQNDVNRLVYQVNFNANLVKQRDAELARRHGVVEALEKVRHLPRHERV
jgi:hypothetical protein